MAPQYPILAIDPGKYKCGLAIVSQNQILLHEVIQTNKILGRIKQILPNKGSIVVGDRTGSREFIIQLKKGIPSVEERIFLVDEHLSSLEARSLYWQSNPPKGLKKLIPVSLQVPPVPIDDYVAIILAQRYVAKHAK